MVCLTVKIIINQVQKATLPFLRNKLKQINERVQDGLTQVQSFRK